MMEAIKHAQDTDMQLLAEMLTTVRAMDKPLQEKWLDYGTGLVEGYKLARRRDEPQKKEG